MEAPRGTNGFGYDPLFVADGFDRTNGELSSTEKKLLNHPLKIPIVGVIRIMALTIIRNPMISGHVRLI